MCEDKSGGCELPRRVEHHVEIWTLQCRAQEEYETGHGMQEEKLALEDIMKVLNDIKKEPKITMNNFNVSNEALHVEISKKTTALQNALMKVLEYS